MTTTTDATIDTDALREAWAKVHGPPNAAAEELLRLNPSYFARVLDFTAHAWRRGPLPPKVKALVLLAVDSAASHLNGPGAADDVRRALALGATPAEVLETLGADEHDGHPRRQHRGADPARGAGGRRAARGHGGFR